MEIKDFILFFFNSSFDHRITLLSFVDTMFTDIDVNDGVFESNHDEIANHFYTFVWNRRYNGVLEYFSDTLSCVISIIWQLRKYLLFFVNFTKRLHKREISSHSLKS